MFKYKTVKFFSLRPRSLKFIYFDQSKMYLELERVYFYGMLQEEGFDFQSTKSDKFKQAVRLFNIVGKI